MVSEKWRFFPMCRYLNLNYKLDQMAHRLGNTATPKRCAEKLRSVNKKHKI